MLQSAATALSFFPSPSASPPPSLLSQCGVTSSCAREESQNHLPRASDSVPHVWCSWVRQGHGEGHPSSDRVHWVEIVAVDGEQQAASANNVLAEQRQLAANVARLLKHLEGASPAAPENSASASQAATLHSSSSETALAAIRVEEIAETSHAGHRRDWPGSAGQDENDSGREGVSAAPRQLPPLDLRPLPGRSIRKRAR